MDVQCHTKEHMSATNQNLQTFTNNGDVYMIEYMTEKSWVGWKTPKQTNTKSKPILQYLSIQAIVLSTSVSFGDLEAMLRADFFF